MRTFLLIALLFFSGAVLATDNAQFTVNLKDPIYKDGVISTDQGGVEQETQGRVRAPRATRDRYRLRSAPGGGGPVRPRVFHRGRDTRARP